MEEFKDQKLDKFNAHNYGNRKHMSMSVKIDNQLVANQVKADLNLFSSMMDK